VNFIFIIIIIIIIITTFIQHGVCLSVSLSMLLCCLSLFVTDDACFLRDKAFVLGDTIKRTTCK
jgi:uncharacterized membrane protein YobD (UPF0266 family)